MKLCTDIIATEINMPLFLDRKKTVPERKKKIKPLPNFTRYGWNRMSRLCDQIFRIQTSNFFYHRFKTYLGIAFNFLFLFFKRDRWLFHWWSLGTGIVRGHQLCLTDTFCYLFSYFELFLSAGVGAE